MLWWVNCVSDRPPDGVVRRPQYGETDVISDAPLDSTRCDCEYSYRENEELWTIDSNLSSFDEGEGTKYLLTLVEFIEYLYYKVNEAIESLDGGQHRGYHRLVRFQQKTKDKAGLLTTVLMIPLAGEDQSLPPPSIASISGIYVASGMAPRSSSEEYEDYDKVRAGECVVVKDRIGDDWLIGHVFSRSGADCKTGRFPTSYVAL
ncbi:unnamed protein product [Angiostrongylus costaricensis]|uniref:SH3 domain-containing protein n=1 Tax=Angiostrongylus costaricensis TaxID=334426 RepID=A0A158PE73_ANGCS|nr:unnamed protein product [Angiostrongylus costaricensis]